MMIRTGGGYRSGNSREALREDSGSIGKAAMKDAESRQGKKAREGVHAGTELNINFQLDFNTDETIYNLRIRTMF